MNQIIMPQFGETTEEEISIIKWLKKPGDTITQGEPLLSVETEKATMDIEAVNSGILKEIVKPEGEIVKPGEIIGYIESE